MKKVIALSLFLVSSSSSVVLAQPAGGAPAPPATKPAPPPAKTPAPAAKGPQAPEELVALGKQMNGTWRCAGKADVMGEMLDVKATITHAVDGGLNKMWIKSNFVGTAPKLPPMKFTAMTTFDPMTKKLWRVTTNGFGGHSVSWGTIADKKVTWEGDARVREGDAKVRQTEEMISAKEVKVVGELSKDGGKTWVKDHEATCKR